MYVYTYIYIYIYAYPYISGNRLSNTTCLAQVFFKSDEQYVDP